MTNPISVKATDDRADAQPLLMFGHTFYVDSDVHGTDPWPESFRPRPMVHIGHDALGNSCMAAEVQLIEKRTNRPTYILAARCTSIADAVEYLRRLNPAMHLPADVSCEERDLVAQQYKNRLKRVIERELPPFEDDD